MRQLKILINGLTLENANLAPLLTNAKFWQAQDCHISFLGVASLKKKIIALNLIKNFNVIEIKETKKITSRLNLITEGLRRNYHSLKLMSKIKNNYDIIYSRSAVLDLIIFPYFFKRRVNSHVKWATVFDNIVDFRNNNKLAWLFFQISLQLLESADKIFVISEDLKKYLLNKNFRPSRIVVTGNALEQGLITTAVADGVYHIDALFIGRINKAKGIYDLLKVLRIVKKRYPNFKLAIMGRGDKVTEKKFKRKIANLSLAENIILLGNKTSLEKYNIIKDSKIFWFLSKTESFGLALLEAVCSGLPAIAYDLEPYKNIYQNNEIFMLPRGDYRAVAEKTLEIFEKKEFDNPRGRLLLEKYGDWNKIAEIEYDTFKRLAI